MKENERLRSAMTCKKCKQTGVETLCLPYRHLVACKDCASNMENCVTCNANILGTVRTYVDSLQTMMEFTKNSLTHFGRPPAEVDCYMNNTVIVVDGHHNSA